MQDCHTASPDMFPGHTHVLLAMQVAAASHHSATLAGTLFGYIGLYLFLLYSYIHALRHLATKPAGSLAMLPRRERPAAEGATQ